ncbi:GH116 family glycosyl-hydrolase [Pirellulales bacterium]|nr:GH116 family glycosyl-hydrolase [Pirellulales bacterium]
MEVTFGLEAFMNTKSFLVVLGLFEIALLYNPVDTAASDDNSVDWPVLKRYDKDHIHKIALPLGGIGTGTISLGGNGALKDWEVKNSPAKGYSGVNSPNLAPFFAVYARPEGGKAKTKSLMGLSDPADYIQWDGRAGDNHGLPRFRDCSFDAAYPLGQVNLSDELMPVDVKLKAFNPLIPGNADDSGIPIMVLRYEVSNTTDGPMEVSVCGSMQSFIGKDQYEYRQGDHVRGIYMFSSDGKAKGTMALSTPMKDGVSYSTSYARYKSPRCRRRLWGDFSNDGVLTEPESHNGHIRRATLAVKQSLAAGETRAFEFYITWHFPNRKAWSQEVIGNYYTTQYEDAWDAAERTQPRLVELEEKTVRFVRAFLSADLPDVVKEAALFNVSTLRTQTVFRTPDGYFFGWEGCQDHGGSCWGSCSHVWLYDQTTPFLFGELSRLQREVDMLHATDDSGLMSFRVPLPIEKASNYKEAATDGQMGAIIKLYRDWQLSGDDDFLKRLWPKAKKAMAFCWVEHGWDADKDGVMEGVQHYTMDVENYGPNPEVGLLYLAALRASGEMAAHMDDTEFSETCQDLFERGSTWVDANLFNGEYYVQDVRPKKEGEPIPGWATLDQTNPENPRYQPQDGSVIVQAVGQLLAHICDLGYVVDEAHARKTMQSIMKYNFRETMSDVYNDTRSYVMGDESALIMHAYKNDELPENPMATHNEAMSGFEYAAASGMLYEGLVDEGLKVIEAIRDRYDGRKRNPYCEIECGKHYARAMAAYGTVLAMTGFNYSGVEKSMRFKPLDGTYFWASGDTYGTVEQTPRSGAVTVQLKVLGDAPLVLDVFELRDFGHCAFSDGHIVRDTIRFDVEPDAP